MKIKVICTTIPTTLTITVPGGSGPLSLEQMHTGPTPLALRTLVSGTKTVVNVGPGIYKIIGDGVSVTADPSSADQVQIAEVSKTDPPEQVKLTLRAAPFTESQLNAFIGASRGGSVPPPR